MRLTSLKAVPMAALMLAAGTTLHAANADADLYIDGGTLAHWFSEQLSNASAFSAAGSLPRPGVVHDLLGVEVGLSGAVTSTPLDVDGFHGLPLTRYDGTTVDLPSRLLMPVPVFHVKVGVPGGFDVGLRFGSANSNENTNDAKSEFKNRVVGVEVRRRLLGGGLTGVALPDVALAVSYDRSTGKVDRTEVYNGPLSGGGSLNATTRWKSDWNTSALALRATASKTLLMFTPYLGVGYAKYMGDTDTSINIAGTVSDPAPTAIDQTSTAKAKPRSGEAQVTGGVEIAFFPLVHLNLGGVVGQKDWGANVGLVVGFR